MMVQQHGMPMPPPYPPPYMGPPKPPPYMGGCTKLPDTTTRQGA